MILLFLIHTNILRVVALFMLGENCSIFYLFSSFYSTRTSFSLDIMTGFVDHENHLSHKFITRSLFTIPKFASFPLNSASPSHAFDPPIRRFGFP